MPGSAPALSVVIPSLKGWPAIAPCLEALAPQARETGAEVLVADGSGRPAGPSGTSASDVVWLSWPGLGIFDLRRRALGRARAPIVVVTEDHCIVDADWCRAVLAAHARHPRAQVIKGHVLNGSRERLLDWAAYLMNQVPHVAPLEAGPFTEVLGISCISFRREALVRLQAESAGPQPELAPRSWVAGLVLESDDRICVTHVQSEGWRGTTAAQYHNARAIAGIRGLQDARDWVRLLAAPLLPWPRTVRVAAACLHKQLPRSVVLSSVPFFLYLFHAKAVGEVMGYLAGPGTSPRRL